MVVDWIDVDGGKVIGGSIVVIKIFVVGCYLEDVVLIDGKGLDVVVFNVVGEVEMLDFVGMLVGEFDCVVFDL